MADQIVETSSQSWISRLMESIKAVLVGLFLFLISIPLLWWNEGRAVQTYNSLMEGAGAVVAVVADKIDAANEGKLIHLNGKAQTTVTLADPDLGVSATAIRMSRNRMAVSALMIRSSPAGGGSRRPSAAVAENADASHRLRREARRGGVIL